VGADLVRLMRIRPKTSVAIAATMAWLTIGWWLPDVDPRFAYALGGGLFLCVIALIEITPEGDEE
jgi:cytosine/uracil/thiamine/allantoin permease